MQSNGNGLERLYTADQVAELLCLKRKTVYAWAEQGRIPCFKIGKALSFRQSELREFIEASRISLTESTTATKVRVKHREGS